MMTDVHGKMDGSTPAYRELFKRLKIVGHGIRVIILLHWHHLLKGTHSYSTVETSSHCPVGEKLLPKGLQVSIYKINSYSLQNGLSVAHHAFTP